MKISKREEELLDKYSQWLLDCGYTDMDILGEDDRGTAVQIFIKEETK